MIQAPTWRDYISINIHWLGLTTIAQTMTPLIVPLLVQQFMGDEVKGTFYGTLRLWTLMAALLGQALMGLLSDRSTLPAGRRRPFIFVGTVADLIIMVLIGFTAGMSGTSGYWTLFFLLILLAAASNTAQAAQQGLISDLVPHQLRGRFSGVKALLEIPLPIILVSFTVARLVSKGNIWAGIMVAMVVVLTTMSVTMFVPERRLLVFPGKLDWQPFIRLAMMTALFTAVILASGFIVRQAINLSSGFESPALFITLAGIAGLLGIVVSVCFGVWISIKIGLEKGSQANPSFTWWVVNRLAFLVGVTNLGSFAFYFLQARLGYIREQAAGPAGNLLMFVGIFILVSALPAGWLADRFGGKRLVTLAGLLAGLGTAVVISIPSLPVIYSGGALIGAASGLFFSANWALGTKLVPPDQAGRFLGISNLAGAGAGAIGGYIGGPLADQISVLIPGAYGIGYLILFGIFGILFLLSAGAIQFVQMPLTIKMEAPA